MLFLTVASRHIVLLCQDGNVWKARSLAPESDVSRLANDLRYVLSREMTRGSSVSGCASFNVGGLRQKLQGLTDLNYDLVGVQE
eukprot:4473856-Amphidinium_carterae.1